MFSEIDLEVLTDGHSFIHSFNKYFLSSYYVPGTFAVLKCSLVNTGEKNPCFHGIFMILKKKKKKISKKEEMGPNLGSTTYEVKVVFLNLSLIQCSHF